MHIGTLHLLWLTVTLSRYVEAMTPLRFRDHPLLAGNDFYFRREASSAKQGVRRPPVSLHHACAPEPQPADSLTRMLQQGLRCACPACLFVKPETSQLQLASMLKDAMPGGLLASVIPAT